MAQTKRFNFLIETFGATQLRRFPNADGSVNHAEVRLDDGVLMIADSVPGWPAQSAYVHVYVEDVDATYQRALANGGESVQAPVQKDDDDKRGGVKDAGGTIWWISTELDWAQDHPHPNKLDTVEGLTSWFATLDAELDAALMVE